MEGHLSLGLIMEIFGWIIDKLGWIQGDEGLNHDAIGKNTGGIGQIIYHFGQKTTRHSNSQEFLTKQQRFNDLEDHPLGGNLKLV